MQIFSERDERRSQGLLVKKEEKRGGFQDVEKRS